MTRHAPATRRDAVLIAALATAVSVAVALLALGLTGGLAAGEGPFDPGALVRFGLPAVKALHDLVAAATVGFLITATWLVSARPDRDPNSLGGARGPLARAAVVASIVWIAASVATVILTAADVSGLPVGSPGFLSVVVSFVAQVDLGRELGASLIAIVVTANLAILATRVTTLAWAAIFSVAALLPLALTGHAAGARDHMNAVDSLAFHLVGVCLWVGGLAALLLIAPRLGDQLPTVARRYSTLAGWCFLTVALSGIVNAWLRLGSLAGLLTPYGLLIIGKALALGALGLAGLAHRRFTLRRIETDDHWFARLAAVELVVMAGTIGLAVALAQSAPPIPDATLDPVSALLGYPAPPPLTPWTYVTVFYPDLLWLVVAVVAAACYLTGVDPAAATRRLLVGSPDGVLACRLPGSGRGHQRRHRGVRPTPLQHPHVAAHVADGRGAVLLGLSARRSRSRSGRCDRATDGSLGPRETLLRIVHSRVLRVLGHPLFSEAFFIVSLVAFYYTLPVPARHVHPRRPRADDGALPAGGLPVHLVADRHRPRPGPAAVRRSGWSSC